jgi:membrane associated rhomboid family serine protease/Zn-finger nucleic acid-binding protein
MLQCPSCQARLSRVQTSLGIIYCCPQCGGRSVSVPVLRKDTTGLFVKNLLTAARESNVTSARRCPCCDRQMKAFSTPGPYTSESLELDYCSLCNHVWFDPQEYPPSLRKECQQGLSPKAREAMALFQIQSEKDSQGAIDAQGPDETWQFIPGILGLPVKFNDHPMSTRPWLTWGLSAAMLLLFAILLYTNSLSAAINEYGFISQQWYRHGGLTILTSLFLHAGVVHLLGNLYFFLIFADNTEDRLGRWKFLLLLLGSHLAGLVLHALIDPRGDLPLIGASGAIAGVISYYAVTFPHAKLGFMIRYMWVFRWIRIPAWLGLVVFILLQLLGSYKQHTGMTGVSYLGHLGGLAVGLAVGLWGIYYPATKADNGLATTEAACPPSQES